MNNLKYWTEQLQHPLVLTGFAFLLIAIIFRVIGKREHSNLRKYIFLLALLVMLAVIIFSWNSTNPSTPILLGFIQFIAGAALNWPATTPTAQPEQNAPSTITGASIVQNTQGEKSPTINTKGDVEINFGG